MVLQSIDSNTESFSQYRNVRQYRSNLLDDMDRDFEDDYNRVEFEQRFDFSYCLPLQRTTADEYLSRGRRLFREYRSIEANCEQDVHDVLNGSKRFISLYATGSGIVNWYLYRSLDGKFWFAVRSNIEGVSFSFKRMSRKQIREILLLQFDDEPDLELPQVIVAQPLPDDEKIDETIDEQVFE